MPPRYTTVSARYTTATRIEYDRVPDGIRQYRPGIRQQPESNTTACRTEYDSDAFPTWIYKGSKARSRPRSRPFLQVSCTWHGASSKSCFVQKLCDGIRSPSVCLRVAHTLLSFQALRSPMKSYQAPCSPMKPYEAQRSPTKPYESL